VNIISFISIANLLIYSHFIN